MKKSLKNTSLREPIKKTQPSESQTFPQKASTMKISIKFSEFLETSQEHFWQKIEKMKIKDLLL